MRDGTRAVKRSVGVSWSTPLLRRVGTAAIVIAAIVWGISQDSNGSGSTSLGSQTKAKVSSIELQEDIEINALLKGIPQHGNTLGQPTAPVTLQFFGDLECFTTKVFAVSFLPSIIHDLVRTNILKIEYRSLETDTHNTKTFVHQQMGALAAGKQDKLWDFILTFYHEQGPEYTGYVTESYLDGIANQIPGLNLAQWNSDREDRQLFKELIGDRRAAMAARDRSTPAFLIGRTGGKMIKLPGYEMKRLSGSLTDALSLKEAIERLS